ncbi:hypothetical protein CWI37_0466p0010 [Hamiltosporidium tvaerminnensis]|uniref:Integrase catalytic domain-containing protein n=1 Tax=Hamiltosporidium tvaerminnensis TaxID=1176355 RepID=A0A4Q9L6L5_9MICR|nr:hypothetical protein CWI37_0466p0010 [Hamiltosporidium tvaerminnensis]
MREYLIDNESYEWILHMLDVRTTFLFGVPLQTKSVAGIANALDNLIFLEGAPSILRTDNGRGFVNRRINKFVMIPIFLLFP